MTIGTLRSSIYRPSGLLRDSDLELIGFGGTTALKTLHHLFKTQRTKQRILAK